MWRLRAERRGQRRRAHDDCLMAMAVGQTVRAEMLGREEDVGQEFLGLYAGGEVGGLAVLAVQAIRRMRGGAQSQLMLGGGR